MLRDNMSNRMAKIAAQVDARGGRVDEIEMDRILRGFGIVRQAGHYKKTLVNTEYLMYDPVEETYRVTKASIVSATITITVKPSLYAEEVRRALAQALAAHEGIIEVGEVEL